MVKIEINNSFSKIHGLSATQEKELREELSYTVGGKSAFFARGFGPRRKSLLNKKCEFPTGLKSKVFNYLDKYAIRHGLVDTRVIPQKSIKTVLFPKINPYPDQEKAASVAYSKGQGTIAMPTGTGKSLTIALLIAKLGVKTLVVVPNLEIKKQMQSTIDDLIGAKTPVTVENIDSKNLKKSSNYDCLIIDEAHHAAAKTYQILNKTVWNNIYYRFFFTATPFRNDPEEELLLQCIAGDIIYLLSYKNAVANKYIVPVESYFIEIPKQTTDAYTWSEVYSQLIVKNDIRNDIIRSLILRFSEAGVGTLCLVKEIAHGKNIQGNSSIPFVNGQEDTPDDPIGMLSAGFITALIGTTGIVGEGVDTKACECVIIAGLGKAKSTFQQQVGRAVRNFPGKETAKIIIIKDKSHKFLLRHFNEQVKILKGEYNSIPQKLDL